LQSSSLQRLLSQPGPAIPGLQNTQLATTGLTVVTVPEEQPVFFLLECPKTSC
jgi:hypothetical protein